ncbi:hypothetical protein I6F35_18175 [Bradyrhizobium sp. BRP22]|uniref:hypothetical protein n=1 Tax=Bradyrhizobium sp. BRP22 TaxID=2793821 RepID=UPI001CD5043F|nr:hypothetical protein [Bradyrhizobium sp. BRP22]MCA1455135.1 hypothetical protein [Bradyrhizobium sp. BRP22]
MTRLPQHSVESGTSLRGLHVDDHAPAITTTSPQSDSIEIERTPANGGKSHKSIFRDTPAQDPAVGATIETALELNSIDAVSRINPNEARTQVSEIDPGSELAWPNGPNLASSLLSFVMPRLRHSDVLRPEKHGLLLARLADALSASPEDSQSREGIGIVQQELRRLVLLRQNHNGLIKG